MNNSRLHYVDGLKGISALFVALCHTGIVVWGLNESSNRPLFTTTPFIKDCFNGNFAVWIFVILSSLLICHGLEINKSDILHQYQKVVTKRYFRLFFPVGVVIILMFVCHKLGFFYAEEYGRITNNEWLIGQYIPISGLFQSLLMAPFGKCGPVLNVGWMLYYIFLGTFIIVILDMIMRGKSPFTVIILSSFCVLMAFWYDFRYISVIYGFFLYNFGKVILRKRCVWFCLFLIIFIFSEFYKHTELWNLIRAAAMVGGVYCSPFLQKIFSTKVLVWLGKLSLNIYLLQLLVLYVFTCRIANCLDMSYGISQFFVLSTTLTIIIMLSWLWSCLVDPLVEKVTRFTISYLE